MIETAEKIPDPELLKYPVPESLRPAESGPRFPHLTKAHLIELANSGWDRIGVIVLVVNPAGEILTVTHGEGNPKVPAGIMGIISETLTFDANSVEQIDEGISRLFMEELGLGSSDIAKLNLEALDRAAYGLVSFPLGAQRYALGFVVVVRTDQKTADAMVHRDTGFKPTNEIRYAGFARPEPLAQNAELARIFRKGTPQALQNALDPLTSPAAYSRITLPEPKEKSPRALEDLKDLIQPNT